MERKIGNPRGVVLGFVCVCVWGGGGGVIHDPSGTEIPSGVWGSNRKNHPLGGGYEYFLESHNTKWFWYLKKKRK